MMGDPYGGSAVILDSQSGNSIQSIDPRIKGEVFDVAFSPDGQQLAVAGKSLSLWEKNKLDDE